MTTTTSALGDKKNTTVAPVTDISSTNVPLQLEIELLFCLLTAYAVRVANFLIQNIFHYIICKIHAHKYSDK